LNRAMMFSRKPLPMYSISIIFISLSCIGIDSECLKEHQQVH
jgi:hypothetical protein